MEHQSITPAGFTHIGGGGVWIIKDAILLVFKTIRSEAKPIC